MKVKCHIKYCEFIKYGFCTLDFIELVEDGYDGYHTDCKQYKENYK
jgi:hypothetical protein